jgi:TonB family protein
MVIAIWMLMPLAAQEAPVVQTVPVYAPPPMPSVMPPPPPRLPAPWQPVKTVPLPRGATPPVPLDSGGWVTSDDYPSAALRAGDEGRVSFTLYVDATGRVTGCAIRQSSGSSLLDNTSCALLQRRARFEPARDRRRRAIASSFAGKFRWVIPAFEENAEPLAQPESMPPPPPMVAPMPTPPRPRGVLAAWSASARMKMQADGTVESCTIETSGKPPSDSATFCEQSKGKRNTMFAAGLKGQPGMILFDLAATIDGEPARAPVTEPGYEQLQAFRIHFDVSETGRSENCRDLPPGRTGSMTLGLSSPCTLPYGPFVPVIGPDGKPRRSGATLDVSLSGKPFPPPDPNAPRAR